MAMSQAEPASAGHSVTYYRRGDLPLSPLPPEEAQVLAQEVAEKLQEPKVDLLASVICHLGKEATQTILERTLQIEAEGGMPTMDGSRRRTPGGVFFYLAKGVLPSKVRFSIFPQWPPPPPPMKWSERLEPVSEALKEPGEARGVKISVIGRPGKIVERGAVVVTTMKCEQAPGLPRGLPKPPLPTTYVIFMAKKQWDKVAPQLQEPGSELIAEGFPGMDERLKTVVVFATKLMPRPPKKKKDAGDAGEAQKPSAASS